MQIFYDSPIDGVISLNDSYFNLKKNKKTKQTYRIFLLFIFPQQITDGQTLSTVVRKFAFHKFIVFCFENVKCGSI